MERLAAQGMLLPVASLSLPVLPLDMLGPPTRGVLIVEGRGERGQRHPFLRRMLAIVFG